MTAAVLIDDNAIRPINSWIMHQRDRIPRRNAFNALEIIDLAKQGEGKLGHLADADRIGMTAEITPHRPKGSAFVITSRVTMLRRADGWCFVGYSRHRMEPGDKSEFKILSPAERQGREPDLFHIRTAVAASRERSNGATPTREKIHSI